MSACIHEEDRVISLLKYIIKEQLLVISTESMLAEFTYSKRGEATKSFSN